MARSPDALHDLIAGTEYGVLCAELDALAGGRDHAASLLKHTLHLDRRKNSRAAPLCRAHVARGEPKRICDEAAAAEQTGRTPDTIAAEQFATTEELDLQPDAAARARSAAKPAASSTSPARYSASRGVKSAAIPKRTVRSASADTTSRERRHTLSAVFSPSARRMWISGVSSSCGGRRWTSQTGKPVCKSRF